MKRISNSWQTAQWVFLDMIKTGELYSLDSVQKRLFTELGSGQFEELLQSLLDSNSVELVESEGATDVESIEEEESGVRITQNGLNLMDYLVNTMETSLAANWVREGDTFVEKGKQKRVRSIKESIITFDDDEVIHDHLLARAMGSGRLSSLAVLDAVRYKTAQEWWDTTNIVAPSRDLPEIMLDDARELLFKDLPTNYQTEIERQFDESCSDPFPSQDALPNQIDVPEGGTPSYSMDDPFPKDIRPELAVPAPELGTTPTDRDPIPAPKPPTIDPHSQPSPEFLEQVSHCPLCQGKGLPHGCPQCHAVSEESPSDQLDMMSDIPTPIMPNPSDMSSLPNVEREVDRHMDQDSLHDPEMLEEDHKVLQVMDELADVLEEEGDLTASQMIDEASYDYQVASQEEREEQ